MGTTYIDSNGNLVTSESKKKKNTYTYIDDNGNLASAEVPNMPTTNKKKKNAWINLTAFDDGYDFGDISKTILGTTGDVATSIAKGVSDVGAGAGKLAVGGIAQVADWTGHDAYANRLRDALAGKNEKTNEFMENYTPSGILGKTNKKLDKYSLSGEKLDQINESIGQIGAYAASGGIAPILGTTAMFGSAAGEGLSQAYTKNGVTDTQAWAKAIGSGAIEVATERLFGLFGTSGLDTGIANKISSKLTNGMAKVLARQGIQATAEGTEEVISYATNQLLDMGLDKLSGKDADKFYEKWNWEQVGEEFASAAIASGIVGAGQTALNVKGIKNDNNIKTKEAINEYAKQMDVAEGVLTDNEQKVLNKELENRIEEKTKDGKSLSKKEINNIKEQIKSDMQKGRISVETIEDALNGNITDNDRLLQTSYNERNNRSVAYNADLSQYNEKQRAIVQKAIDSGVLNNTNRSHELVDLVAKLSEDKGMDFDFVNNEKLKNTGFALEGKQVNGYNTGTSIGINIDSNKALNSVIGHEITHVLEGTDLYNELQKSITEYAKTKGEYDARLKELQELYKDVKDANVENELTSDLVGDYLFTDEDFVNRLYNNNRNVFQKIYDEIKYFVKQVAPGSKEAKQLEQVKRAFEKAYNQKNTNVDNSTKFMIDRADIIEDYTDLEKNTLLSNKNNIILNDINEIDSFVDDAYNHKGLDKILHYGVLKQDVINKIKDNISNYPKNGWKFDKNQYELAIREDSFLHLSEDKANISKEDVKKFAKKLPDIVANFDTVEYSNNIKNEGLRFTKKFDDGNYISFVLTSDKKNRLLAKSISMDKESYANKNRSISPKANDKTLAKTSETNGASASSASNIPQNQKNVKYSISQDNQGRELSKQQQEYFKDSKVRDENGNLLTMYHGTPNGGFNEFNEGSYFTPNKNYADNYQDENASILKQNKGTTNKQTYEVYLDITNPFELKNNVARDIYINEFIKDGNSGFFDPYTSYNDYVKQFEQNDGFEWLEAEELADWLKENHPEYDGLVVQEVPDPTNPDAPNLAYIIFKQNQVKNIDNTNPTSNEDIRYSLSEQNKKIAPIGNYQIKGKDVKLEKIAPVKETKEKVNIPIREDVKTKTENNKLTKAELDELDTLQSLDDVGFLSEKETKRFEELKAKQNNIEVKNTETNLDTKTRDKIARNLKEELSLNSYEMKEFKKAIDDIANNKKITENQIKEIIEKRFGEKTHKSKLEDIAEIQKVLKNRAVKVSDSVKVDIKDYSDFRQKNYGKIKFSKEGMGVDQVYEELSREYPGFFPNTITTPSEQLQEMAYVANLDKYVNETSYLSEQTINDAAEWIYDSIEDYNLQQKVKNGELTYDEYKEQSNIGKLKKTRKDVQNELKNEMNITLEDLDVGKDISSIGYQRTDPIRLNEKVFGAEVGQKINDATINRTKHNEAERTRFLNKERQEIKDLGIKARSAESAAVQKYGEKQYVDDKGVIHKYGDAELAAEFPNVETQDKIKEAAKVLREKYDTYLEDINSVITEMGYDPIPKRQDYMRHFQEINDKLSQWGIPLNPTDMSKDALPTDINGVTDQFKPGKNWFASAMQRKGFKTTYDAITGIDGYLEGASNLMYHTGDIQRYRTLSKMIRETYGQQHGMDNLDVSTKEGQQRLNDIMDNKLSKYAAWLDEQANALAGKKGGIDRAAERLLGRKIYTVLDTAKKQVGSNMTGFNVRSALTNFASAVQGASKTKKTAFIKGTISTFKNMVHNDGLINKSDFLTNRFGSDQLSKKAWQKASNAGQIFMTGTDYFTANQIWRSKYYENLSNGMNETQAIKNADDFASRIMGDRSKGSTAEIFNSKTLGLLTQFQLEVNNQWSSIVHDNKMDIQRGNKSGATVVFQLGELAAASYFFNNLMRSLTGSDVMIDPIDMLMKMLGADDDDKDKTVGERANEVIGDLIDDLPFASIMTGGRVPMSEAFKGAGTAFKKLSGQKDKYGNDIEWKDVKKDLIESGYYWLLPTGYGQLKKTKSGLSMYDKNLPVAGSYTDSGNLRFRADESTGGKIKAALFGQYSSDEAQKYLNSGYKTINKNRIQELKDLDMKASEYRKYREDLNNAGTKNSDKIDFISKTNYTDKQKSIMAENVLKKPFDMKKYKNYGSYEEADYAIKNPEKYLVSKVVSNNFDNYKNYLSEIKNIKGNKDSRGKTITNSRKTNVINYINNLDEDYGSKLVLYKMEYPNDDTYNFDIVEYLNNKNNITQKEEIEILKYLGMTIDKDGTVRW